MLKAVQTGSRQNAQAEQASQAPLLHSARPAQAESPLARMQHAFGNQRLLRLANGGMLQRKLTINQPGDAFEQEADRVADTVMRMTDPASASAVPQEVSSESTNSVLQRCSCGASSSSGGECEECKSTQLQRSADAPSASTDAPPIVHDVLRSPGQPLDSATRSFMEPRFGADFSNVRVHTDPRAAESAKAVNALAYTVGNNVVFGHGRFSPQTQAGQKLMAHELAHTVQQGMAGEGPQLHRKCGPADFSFVPADCDLTQVSAGDKPKGTRFLFNINCDDFAPGERAKLEALADASNIPSNADVEVLGLASSDGDASFNTSLSCGRAAAGADVLKAKGFGANIKSVKASGGVVGTTHNPNFRAVEIAITKKAAPAQDPTFSIVGKPKVSAQKSQNPPSLSTFEVSQSMGDFDLSAQVGMQATQPSDFDDWNIGAMQTVAAPAHQTCFRFPPGVAPPPTHKHPTEVFVGHIKQLPGLLLSDRDDSDPNFMSVHFKDDLAFLHHGRTSFTFPVTAHDTPRIGAKNGLFNITQDPDDSRSLLFQQHKFGFFLTYVVARQKSTSRVIPLYVAEWFAFIDIAYDPSPGTGIPPTDHIQSHDFQLITDHVFSSADVPPVASGPSVRSLDVQEGNFQASCPPF